jgi:D-alanyl-lipoteichoic acid acyltransferase DltB (MBOAT superfamily)
MLFNSLAYAVFLPVVMAGYFLLQPAWRALWLLLASCAFYMYYKPVYILVLAVLILIDYIAAIKIQGATPERAKWYFRCSIGATLAVLAAFKYGGFLFSNLTAVAAIAGFNTSRTFPPIALPIGLSFHTFQSMAYVIEVYRGRQQAERNPIVYATYVLFFPQLVAGPIERPGSLLHQFREHHSFDPKRIASGLKRIAWGLFKKAVIADRLGMMVNDIFDRPTGYGGFYLCLGAVAFTYQVYCDFSGYCDMALGSAEILGFRLSENFDSPFRSRSISEFWRRWHITLSQWFRDFVYIPLGGNRGTLFIVSLNLLITFSLSGLWHGASWNFVLWGALNGLGLIVERALQPWWQRVTAAMGISESNPLRAGIAICSTFFFTSTLLVVFRAGDLAKANYMLTHLFKNWRVVRPIETANVDQEQIAIALLCLVILELVQFAARHSELREIWDRAPFIPRWGAYAALTLTIALFGVFVDAGTFIYFQF